jgi:1-aminocyclopropane-1-carboxylate deaminase/D-cysteine desulfhydrase-like pyridoxal-dependent ACC family enzyme
MRLASLPRYPLTTTPTPLKRARNLELALGPASPRISIKRDDLTGLAFGGNKARKLEYLVADAIAHGATVLVTEGAVQSNHARLTAAAAVVAGLKALLVLDARRGTEVQGNLLLDRLMGVDVRIVPDKAARADALAAIMAELKAAGETPYLIPTGGSVPLGALGYVAFVLELTAQLVAAGESPSKLYFASGSAGTQSGIVVGANFASPASPSLPRLPICSVSTRRLTPRMWSSTTASPALATASRHRTVWTRFDSWRGPRRSFSNRSTPAKRWPRCSHIFAPVNSPEMIR